MEAVYPSRASSTKTRIETSVQAAVQAVREIIKSKFHENKDWNILQMDVFKAISTHQEQVPRKQGLKPKLISIPYIRVYTSRASSTKTRIETPLKETDNILPDLHQEQVPRKQGLKLSEVFSKTTISPTSRASSTKTRIETQPGTFPHSSLSSIKSKFHENKDWNTLDWRILTGRLLPSRASSTKTRIETLLTRPKPIAKRPLHQEQVPRKQGLKLR